MLTIENVGISAIAATVPGKCINNSDLSSVYGEIEVKKLISSIGVEQRHISGEFVTSADLCLDAARNLFKNVSVPVEKVQAVIFVSQTPDYQLPATACILQDKLGIPTSSMAFDINMGCSGYVYGLQVASSLINSGLKNVLLLVGDTVSKIVKPHDRSTELLFGDAGTATLVSFTDNSKITFEFGTDGSGFEHIIAKVPKVKRKLLGRADNYSFLEMNGGEVFSFTLRTVPKLVNGFIENLGLTPDYIDNCFYHQANHFMLKHLSKKSKFTQQQVPISIDRFGNTSGASIPLTLCYSPRNSYKNTLLVGFGVGLSWGIVHCDLTQTKLIPVSEFSDGK
ncbi:ketoacyl-ACP synthase III [Shewanella yunxiaonensis]|uniref:Ketoacyl-ACP synthase III n=1 Tax=Shewanella yunxiaonensis TaxID=2829809 RepID=A0ABX7YW31_9GAMM|nr:ketoacyl-ACP synthase III [Shewanella yunxiaonensis]QUN06899.1 ketoacyl-ACP synthase III [Shewanella yunxiaonensis]